MSLYSPRLGKLPAAGKSRLSDRFARLGFAPTANGRTGYANRERQGLNSTIVDDDRAPINVFPIDPDNRQREGNNYSPMWDAHVYVWTDEAVAGGKRRRVNSFEDLLALKNAGLVTDAPTNKGPANSYVAGLRASGLIINCPARTREPENWPITRTDELHSETGPRTAGGDGAMSASWTGGSFTELVYQGRVTVIAECRVADARRQVLAGQRECRSWVL